MPDPATEYQRALADALRPLNRRILQSLTKRPEQEGREAFPFEVELLANGLPEALTPVLETLAVSVPDLLDERCWLPPEERAHEAVDAVAEVVDSLIEMLLAVRNFPFPCGLEDGQPVLTAIVERPLRELLAAFDGLVAAIEDEEAEEARFEVNLDLSGEAAAIAQWLRRQGWPGAQSSCSWTRLAAAFFLGRWSLGT